MEEEYSDMLNATLIAILNLTVPVITEYESVDRTLKKMDAILNFFVSRIPSNLTVLAIT